MGSSSNPVAAGCVLVPSVIASGTNVKLPNSATPLHKVTSTDRPSCGAVEGGNVTRRLAG